MKQYKQNIFPIIVSAIDKMVDFISPTYGPANNKIILNNKVLDDGFAIAEEFELDDPFENAVLQRVKEVSAKTNARAGDGTTGSLLLVKALFKAIERTDTDSSDIVKELSQGLEEAKEQLLKQAKKIETQQDLEEIAFNSFNNREIAKIIAESVFKVGVDGAVTVENSNSLETTYEIVEGMQLDQGYVSPYMATNFEKMEAVYQDIPVLVTDKKISAIAHILPLLEKLSEHKRNLVIIADSVEGEALTTLVVNKMRGGFPTLAIKAPGFGDRKREILEDIVAMVGGELISDEKGMDMSSIKLEQLGTIKKIICGKDSTIIAGGSGTRVEERIAKIKNDIENVKYDFDRKFLEERLAKLAGGVAVIKVGALTESELNSLKFKVEDAVNAAKAAFRGGVIKGAGLALKELETSSELLNQALKYPNQKLRENTQDINPDVHDPVDVIVAALESAVSIVRELISSKGILIDKHELPTNS